MSLPVLTSADEAPWLSAVEAARYLGCHPRRVRELARRGLITVRKLPGCDPRYLLSDVQALAERYTRRATEDVE